MSAAPCSEPAAGGFKATASRQRVLIERILPPAERTATGRDRVTIDVSSSALDGVGGPAIPLQDGDVVRVFPVAERVRNRIFVDGNVFQRGAQGLSPSMRLSDALRHAGLKPDTYLAMNKSNYVMRVESVEDDVNADAEHLAGIIAAVVKANRTAEDPAAYGDVFVRLLNRLVGGLAQSA